MLPHPTTARGGAAVGATSDHHSNANLTKRSQSPVRLPPFASPPPPSYAQAQSQQPRGAHDPSSRLDFPAVPTTELLPPIQPASAHGDNGEHHHHALPSLSSLTGGAHQPLPPQRFGAPPPPPQPIEPSQQPQQQPQRRTPPAPPPPAGGHWPSLNPFTTYYTPSHAQAADSPARMDVDVSSNSAVSAASPDRFYDGRASSVSLDDPDVRMAAEALGDLRAGAICDWPESDSLMADVRP